MRRCVCTSRNTLTPRSCGKELNDIQSRRKSINQILKSTKSLCVHELPLTVERSKLVTCQIRSVTFFKTDLIFDRFDYRKPQMLKLTNFHVCKSHRSLNPLITAA